MADDGALGRRAVLKSWLSQAHLDECLAIVADMKRQGLDLKLGEVLVRKNLLTQSQVDELARQPEEKHKALEAGLITRDQLLEAMKAKAEMDSQEIPMTLEEVLVRKKFLTQKQLDDMNKPLAEARTVPAPAARRPTRVTERRVRPPSKRVDLTPATIASPRRRGQRTVLWMSAAAALSLIGLLCIIALRPRSSSAAPPADPSSETPGPVVEKPKEKPKPPPGRPPDEVWGPKYQSLLSEQEKLGNNLGAALKLWEDFEKEVDDAKYRGLAREKKNKLLELISTVTAQKLKEVRTRAEEKAQMGLYEEAIKEWEKFPTEIDPTGSAKTEIERQMAPLYAWRDFTAVRKTADRMARAGMYDEAVKLYERHLDSAVPQIQEETRRRIDEIETLRVVSKLKPRLQERREKAKVRIREVELEIAEDARIAKERVRRQEERLKEATAKTPLLLRLKTGTAEYRGPIVRFTGDAVTVSTEKGKVEITQSLDALTPETQLQIMDLCVDKSNARELFDLGKTALLNQKYDLASGYFTRAAELDPALKPVLPDVERIRQKRASIRGEYSTSGSQVKVDYSFQQPAEIDDFGLRGAEAKLQGGLQLSGDATFYALETAVTFVGEASVVAAVGPASSCAHLVLITYKNPAGKTVTAALYVVADRTECGVVQMSAGEKPVTLLQPSELPSAPKTLELTYRDGSLVAFVNGEKIFSQAETIGSDMTVGVGGATVEKDKPGAVSFSRVMVSGSVSKAWQQKFEAESKDVLEAELNKELRLKGAPAAGVVLEPTSLDALIEALPEAQAEEMKQGLADLNASFAKGSLAKRESAVAHFKNVVQKLPNFPLPHYYIGAAQEVTRDYDLALEAYGRACEIEPEFAEALIGRGAMYRVLGRFEDAQRDFDEAARLVPDLYELYIERARLFLRDRRRAEALHAARIAEKLRSWDSAMTTFRKQIENLIRGPLWKSPQKIETEHFLIQSDLPRDKVKAYADQLEALHKHFQTVLGDGPPVKEEVLIFNTREGFYNYTDLITGERLEGTQSFHDGLSCQLIAYEGSDRDRTTAALYSGAALQFVKRGVPMSVPWFNRGMAEYLASVDIVKNAARPKVREDMIQRLRGLLGRLDEFKSRRCRPRDFMMQSYARFYDEDSNTRVVLAWSFVDYLMSPAGRSKGGATWDAYLKAIREGTTLRSAYERTFGKIDIEELETSWLDYLRGLAR